MKISEFGAFCLVSLLSSAVLAAQASSSIDTLLELSLEDLMNTPVFGPTRTSKNLQKVPASVTVFRRSELQNMGVDFLFELLSYVPGFQTSRDNDYGGSYVYSSRGSDTGQDTTAILLLIDGVPRQGISNSSASTLSSLMPVDRIERIEVIRGPGSALYGSGAFLGIINIVTVAGDNAIKASAGQSGRQELQGQFSAGSGDWRFDLFVSGYKDEGDDYFLDDRLRNDPIATSDPQSTQNYSLRLGYRNTLVTFEHVNIESEDYYSVSTINNDLNEMRNFLNLASIEQAIEWGALQSTLRFSYSENEQRFTAQATLPGQLAAISNPSSNDFLVGDALFKDYSWQAQWLNDWAINERSSLQFGLEQQYDKLDVGRVRANFDTSMLAIGDYPVAYSAEGDIESEPVHTGSRNIFGVYAQLQHQLNTKTDVTFGARYDDYEGFDGQASLRLAIVHQISGQHSLKLLYGEAFRAPTLSQMSVKETLRQAPNPDLEAESIRATELVWLTQQSTFSFSASAFYNVIDDQIDSSGFIDGRSASVNSGREFSSGLELEGTVQVDSSWIVRAGVTEFIKLPESSSRESEHLASLIVNYQQDKWWANVSGYYNSKRAMPTESDGVIGSFTQLNTKVGYQFSNDLRAYLQVKNLLDADVASSPQSTSINTPIPYRGREPSIGITYAF